MTFEAEPNLTQAEAHKELGELLLDAIREQKAHGVGVIYPMVETTLDWETLLRHAYGEGDLFLHITGEGDDVALAMAFAPLFQFENGKGDDASDWKIDPADAWVVGSKFRQQIVVQTLLQVYSYMTIPHPIRDPRERRHMN